MRYVLYGALGLGAMWFVARRPLEQVLRLTGPLLAIALGCLVLVPMPGFGMGINGARAGSAPAHWSSSRARSRSSRTRPLTRRRFLAERPNRIRTLGDLTPLGLVAGGRRGPCSRSSPISGPHSWSPRRCCADVRVGSAQPSLLLDAARVRRRTRDRSCDARPYRRARLTSFLNPWTRPATPASRLSRVRSRSGPAACSGTGSAIGAEDRLPARGPHRLHPRALSARSSASSASSRCCSSTR